MASPLPSPRQLTERLPLAPTTARAIEAWRMTAASILRQEDPRLALILGPCSIHDPAGAFEYGEKLQKLQKEVEDSFFLIMRVFLEKPRTRVGWKGLLYDPHLDGSNDLQEGLLRSRKMLLELNAMGVPCATEFLEPLVSPYLEDLVTWGVIGARTTASQPHRQLASGLPFPVGFKNGIHGELDIAFSALLSARLPHSRFSIDSQGRIASAPTAGNPLVHLTLRGSDEGPNCDPASVTAALSKLKAHHLPEWVAIDCAHGNSGKDPAQQKWAFEIAMRQVQEGQRSIRALFLESYLKQGRQAFPEDPALLEYGLSITDACLGWEETAELVKSMQSNRCDLSKNGVSKSRSNTPFHRTPESCRS
jgi:3-deoxy-7-phosphoheptulonate synthase